MDSEQPIFFPPEFLELDWDVLEAGAGIRRRLFKTSVKECLLYGNKLFIYYIEIVLQNWEFIRSHLRRLTLLSVISVAQKLLPAFLSFAFMENLSWCRMEAITTHSAQGSGKWIGFAAEREMWNLFVCFWKKLDQSSWPWAAGRKRNPAVKPVGFEAKICRNAAWGGRKCIRVYFHFCGGRKPEEYLIS